MTGGKGESDEKIFGGHTCLVGSIPLLTLTQQLPLKGNSFYPLPASTGIPFEHAVPVLESLPDQVQFQNHLIQKGLFCSLATFPSAVSWNCGMGLLCLC